MTELEKSAIDNNKPVAVLGDVDTGKTNLTVYLASLCSHPKKYILGYPGSIAKVINLSSMNDLSKIDNCVLMIDEIEEFIEIYDKKDNSSLRRLIKFAEHNKIKLIFNTQLSQFINKTLEALVPQWAILPLDMFSLKNGSKPKSIILDRMAIPEKINPEIGMKLEKGEFIWYNDKAIAGENGLKKYPFMHIGKDWGNNAIHSAPETPQKIANKIANNPPKEARGQKVLK